MTTVETIDPTQVLLPDQHPGDARQEAVAWGPNLTIVAGDTIGVKTADGLCYRSAVGNADGTQNAVGFAMYSFKTDANGKVYLVSGSDTATPTFRIGPWSTSPIWKRGVFQLANLKIGGVGATLANLQTLFGGATRIFAEPSSFIRLT